MIMKSRMIVNRRKARTPSTKSLVAGEDHARFVGRCCIVHHHLSPNPSGSVKALPKEPPAPFLVDVGTFSCSSVLAHAVARAPPVNEFCSVQEQQDKMIATERPFCDGSRDACVSVWADR